MNLQALRQALRIPDEVAEIVHHQVSFFRNFSPLYVTNHYKTGDSDMILRFKGSNVGIVKNNELMERRHLVKTRAEYLSAILNMNKDRVIQEALEELDLIIPFCFSDKSEKPLQHIPALVFSKERFSNNILIPSVNNLLFYNEFSHVDNHDRPLFHKENKMCLAASLTNIYWNEKGIEHNQRLQIGERAAKEPDKYFCRIMRPPKFDQEEWNDVCKKVDESFPTLSGSEVFVHEEQKVPVTDQLKYKVHLCVDGHTCAWARLPWQMYSNSVVFKIRNPDSDFVEWFYYLLDPSKHFLEIDIDQIDEAYEYIINEPDAQLDISKAASEFAEKYLNNKLGQNIFLYTLFCLNEKQRIKLDD